MSEVVVQAIDVAKSYRRGKVSVPALTGLDLEVKKGETVSIIGPSGSGKTTLLNLVGGLDVPNRGKIVIDGTDLSTLSDPQLTAYRLQKVGFIFQFYNLIPTFSAIENVEVPMSFAGVPAEERRTRAEELLRTVGLQDRISHKPDEMSGGEQQRVAVARALANNPSLLLGDEPTGDLDSRSAKALMELVKSMRSQRKMTLVFVTHDPIVVARSDRAFAIRDGKIAHELSGKDLQNARRSDEYDTAMAEGVY
jgi:putative ABC transport system ATP-binding protein